MLAKAAGYAPTQMDTFQEPPRGSLQTREVFLDQVLVHRVMEPYKAFRWLMLSSNCHAGARACAMQRNRTHGLSPQGTLPTSPDAELDGAVDPAQPPPAGMRHHKDWISSAIPKARPDARTGATPLYALSPAPREDQPPKERGKRKHKGRRRRGRRHHATKQAVVRD